MTALAASSQHDSCCWIDQWIHINLMLTLWQLVVVPMFHPQNQVCHLCL